MLAILSETFKIPNKYFDFVQILNSCSDPYNYVRQFIKFTSEYKERQTNALDFLHITELELSSLNILNVPIKKHAICLKFMNLFPAHNSRAFIHEHFTLGAHSARVMCDSVLALRKKQLDVLCCGEQQFLRYRTPLPAKTYFTR